MLFLVPVSVNFNNNFKNNSIIIKNNNLKLLTILLIILIVQFEQSSARNFCNKTILTCTAPSSHTVCLEFSVLLVLFVSSWGGKGPL